MTMTAPSSTRPQLGLRVIAMTVFTVSMLWAMSLHGEFDWKTVISIVLWGITIGLWTWGEFGLTRKAAEPDY